MLLRALQISFFILKKKKDWKLIKKTIKKPDGDEGEIRKHVKNNLESNRWG